VAVKTPEMFASPTTVRALYADVVPIPRFDVVLIPV